MQAAEQPLTEFDLFASTLIHPDSSVPGLENILRKDDYKAMAGYNEPKCNRATATSMFMRRLDGLMVQTLTIPHSKTLTNFLVDRRQPRQKGSK